MVVQIAINSLILGIFKFLKKDWKVELINFILFFRLKKNFKSFFGLNSYLKKEGTCFENILKMHFHDSFFSIFSCKEVNNILMK